MEFSPLETVQYYAECAPLVEGLGYALVELRVGHTKSRYQVRVVITHRQYTGMGIGIGDCSKVHRLLLARLEVLFHSQEIYMEVTSPGTERLIKNAAEFPLFCGRTVRVWDTEVKDWVGGKIVAADKDSLTLDIDGTERVIPFEQIAKAKLLT